MSVGYSMEYSVIIKGTRAEFEQIPAVAQQALDNYKAALEKAKKEGRYYGWDVTWHYESLAEEITELAKDALETDGEPLLMELENSDGDDTHGDFEDFLTVLDENLPGLSIAVYAVYVDEEYGGPDTPSILYSPSGSSALDLKNFSGMYSTMAKLPDEDWIPYGWRHPDEKTPAAKAEGTVTLLGDWSETEKSIVDKALMGGALEAMGYTAFEKGGEAVSRTDEGWEFSVGGAMDAGDVAQNLHLALLSYIEKHQASYAALCKAMREKNWSSTCTWTSPLAPTPPGPTATTARGTSLSPVTGHGWFPSLPGAELMGLVPGVGLSAAKVCMSKPPERSGKNSLMGHSFW